MTVDFDNVIKTAIDGLAFNMRDLGKVKSAIALVVIGGEYDSDEDLASKARAAAEQFAQAAE